MNTVYGWLWEILVPDSDNDGKKFALSKHHEWDEHVKELAGGLTILRTTKGKWQDTNEKMIPVRVMCHKQIMDQIVKFTLEHYDQDAVMYYKISRECYIRHRTKK